MTDDVLRPADLLILARISSGNNWLRSVLCTLARRGTQLRQQEPERATELIGRLAPWPWFKGGQFLFDLLEWEDFMVDGPPPAPLATVLRPENWERLDALLGGIRRLMDAAADDAEASTPSTPTGPTDSGGIQFSVAALTGARASDANLPALEPGLHLYRDVVLGIWASTNASG